MQLSVKLGGRKEHRAVPELECQNLDSCPCLSKPKQCPSSTLSRFPAHKRVITAVPRGKECVNSPPHLFPCWKRHQIIKSHSVLMCGKVWCGIPVPLCPVSSTAAKSGRWKGVIKIHVLKAWYLQVVKENADVASVSGAGVFDWFNGLKQEIPALAEARPGWQGIYRASPWRGYVPLRALRKGRFD